MSKIEDALKKAIDTGIVKYPGNSAANSGSDENTVYSISKDLVSIDNKRNNITKRNVSVKEIALMENTSLLNANELSELKVIYSDMDDTRLANTYRDLRTKLIQKTGGRNAVVLVTSCVPGNENCSTVVNLATAFSFDKSKTSIIVDCNIMNPEIDKTLNLKTDKGLVDFLEDESIGIDNVIYETGIKRLRLVPSGVEREVATEHFTSARMKGLMKELVNRYPDRYVFINSAPITESADTKILVELCDYVLQVVPYGKSTMHKINESIESVDKNKLLGVVFMDKPRLPNIKKLVGYISEGLSIIFRDKLKNKKS